MGIDVRIPIGLLFTLVGLILAIFGAVSDRAIYQRSLGINVNLGWGLVLLVFGIVMLLLGRRGNRAEHAAAPQSDRPPAMH
jgi:hypothetical protein